MLEYRSTDRMIAAGTDEGITKDQHQYSLAFSVALPPIRHRGGQESAVANLVCRADTFSPPHSGRGEGFICALGMRDYLAVKVRYRLGSRNC